MKRFLRHIDPPSPPSSCVPQASEAESRRPAPQLSSRPHPLSSVLRPAAKDAKNKSQTSTRINEDLEELKSTSEAESKRSAPQHSSRRLPLSSVLRPATKDAKSKSQTSTSINEDLEELEVSSSSGITVSSLEETAEQMIVELERDEAAAVQWIQGPNKKTR